MLRYALLFIVIFCMAGCQFISGKTNSTEVFRNRSVENDPSANASKRAVYINDERLSDDVIEYFETKYRIRIQDGDYWYDSISGGWGVVGGPVLGLILPNLDIGGELKEDASGGNTGVYINGRELHRTEVAYLMTLGPVYQGRYWLDARGNVGVEGQPAFANLYQIMRQKGGNTFYRNSYTGTGSGGDGETFYVIGKDWSYVK